MIKTFCDKCGKEITEPFNNDNRCFCLKLDEKWAAGWIGIVECWINLKTQNPPYGMYPPALCKDCFKEIVHYVVAAREEREVDHAG